jgi:hypothetical protein
MPIGVRCFSLKASRPKPSESTHSPIRKAYSGKPAEAKAQFARAAMLDLTPSEKSELARVPPHV